MSRWILTVFQPLSAVFVVCFEAEAYHRDENTPTENLSGYVYWGKKYYL